VTVFPNPDAKSRLLVSHGNGLASFGYRAFWEPLREHFEVIALDMRGHGASEPGDAVLHTVEQFVIDLQSVLGVLSATDPRPLIGAFHSLSALVALMQLKRLAHVPPWQALVLFDPPLTAPAEHALATQHRDEMAALSSVTARRRVLYATVEERVAQFSRSDVFGTWVPGAAHDMAAATLRADRDTSGWRLSCDPALEAFIYRSGTQPEAWDALSLGQCPIVLISGDPYRAEAESPARTCLLASERLGIDYAYAKNAGHFLQLEQPERCREALLAFIAKVAARFD
jgi:pimeloyl-ACP methyl ester carboxylesterase